MANNNDVVLGIPSMQCPSCRSVLELTKCVDKMSKTQIRSMRGEHAIGGAYQVSVPRPDDPSQCPEKNYIIVSCGNFQCEQYNKFKVVEIPRLKAPSAAVDLE